MKLPKIQDLNLNHKRVFLRADLNIPLRNNEILQDFKIKSILPTIDHIQQNGGKVILATHIGRPNAKSQTNFFDEKLSTKILVNWFEQNGYKIKYEIDLKNAESESKQNFDEILLLENLRFFNGEQEANLEFAKILSKLGDIYINDAFGINHRNDTSVTLLAELFEQQRKAFGLLVQKELKNLNKLKENVEQPFLIILGGNKIKKKIKILENFISQESSNHPTSILIGGEIKKEFIKPKFFKNIKIFLPEDFVNINGKDVDIGPNTISSFKNEIEKAKTFFVNGTMGIYEKKESADGTKEILTAVANSNGFTIVGGGDAVSATFLFNVADKINFLSTGGGSTLTFLSCKKPFEKMPGLNSIVKL